MAVRVIELIGSSKENFGEAVEDAVQQAAQKYRGLKGLKVAGFSAKIEGGQIVEYRANVKIAYVIED